MMLVGLGCETGGGSTTVASASASASSPTASATETVSGTGEDTDASMTTPATTADATDTVADTDPPKFDHPIFPDLPPVDLCAAQDLDLLAGGGGTPPCDEEAMPESFEPMEEWRYPPGTTGMQSWVTPLVINWNDDNGDGTIDMCDGPDVILTAFGAGIVNCEIHIIDGDYGNSGIVHDVIDDLDVHCTGNPAVGDIDNDGVPELVAVSNNASETLLAIDNDGTLMWESDTNPNATGGAPWKSGGIALHDMNADGTYEIIYNHSMYDNAGTQLFNQADPQAVLTWLQASTAADLDGDGDLELLTAFSAHDFDDSWNATTLWDYAATAVLPPFSIPQVANFDDDPDPEVLYTSDAGYLVAEHDGTVKWGPVKPALAQSCAGMYWGGFMRAAAIHDYDADGEAEFASAACNTFAIYDVTEAGPVIITEEIVQDNSGGTGTTAFDFLGDGSAEPVYSDETNAWAWSYDGMQWEPRLQLARFSPTYMEYPSVADIDNDGSAEILVPSADASAPALVVFGDARSRWIQARRIFNQFSYSITHTNEDGTVPTVPLRNWEYFNTFRTNSQIEGGALCDPAG
jgi:hypothetical protein